MELVGLRQGMFNLISPRNLVDSVDCTSIFPPEISEFNFEI